MKLSHRLGLAMVLLSLTSLAACSPRQKRTDWRTPATHASTPCESDSDCPNGTCAVEIGATKGTCSPANLAPLPGADGGTRPGPPAGPSVQPSPNDIQI